MEFMSVFPDIVNDLTEGSEYNDIPEVIKWHKKVLEYNVPHGKKARGLTIVMSYKMIENPINLTPENLKLANIMGWCVEILQGCFLVLDDITDSSETRRGEPCWYKNPGIGLNGINDGIYLEQAVYSVLKKHFSNHPCYLLMLELFHDISLRTCIGQSMDNFLPQKDGRPDLDAFTMELYGCIVTYKTSYYTFYLPVGIAMYLAGVLDPELHSQAKTILLEMGQLYQIQDDHLDCYADEELTGKRGTDIREGKCTWLVVVALKKANPAQRRVLEENYGRPELEAIQSIRDLYEELDITKEFLNYEEETYKSISALIRKLKGLPQNLFFKLLEKIYKRKC